MGPVRKVPNVLSELSLPRWKIGLVFSSNVSVAFEDFVISRPTQLLNHGLHVRDSRVQYAVSSS